MGYNIGNHVESDEAEQNIADKIVLLSDECDGYCELCSIMEECENCG